MDQSKFRQRVEDKKEDLISLTQDLIKIPTVNPPGEFYSDCVEYLNKRFKSEDFDTQVIRARGTPGIREKFLSTTPLGRFSIAENTGRAAVYLCNDQSSLVTGTALEIDEGRTL